MPRATFNTHIGRERFYTRQKECSYPGKKTVRQADVWLLGYKPRKSVTTADRPAAYTELSPLFSKGQVGAAAPAHKTQNSKNPSWAFVCKNPPKKKQQKILGIGFCSSQPCLLVTRKRTYAAIHDGAITLAIYQPQIGKIYVATVDVAINCEIFLSCLIKSGR